MVEIDLYGHLQANQRKKKKKEEILFEMVDILDGTESWCIL
jgi:hypothetical protein